LKTGKVNPNMNAEWHQIIRDAIERGAKMQRIHVVKKSLSDYLRYEIEQYKYNKKFGEEILLVEMGDFQKLSKGINFDFWLY
jgi:3-dehydroquinate dehydratase